MRPYRAIPIDGKEFVYGWHFERGGGSYIIPITDNYHTPASFVLTFVQVIPETVGQQVGLKDKNGKEIYKGDIDKQEYAYDTGNADDGISDEGYYIGEVIISPSQGVCLKRPMRTNGEGETKKINWNVNVRTYRSEIVGNKWENPKLLEQGK